MNLGMISGGGGERVNQSVSCSSVFLFFPFILHIFSYFLLGEKKEIRTFWKLKSPPKALASLSW